MNRRIFLACGLALPLVGVESAPKLPPREFRRYIRATDSWEFITPQTIQVGDIVWVYDPPKGSGIDEVIHISRVDHAESTVYSDQQIDPKTNQWVPVVM